MTKKPTHINHTERNTEMDLMAWAAQIVEETRKRERRVISTLKCILEENRNNMTREEISHFIKEIAKTEQAFKKMEDLLIYANDWQKLLDKLSQS
jgi:DNA-binding transcriptional regulator YhcF (GntR family)